MSRHPETLVTLRSIIARSGANGQQLYRAADNGTQWMNGHVVRLANDLSGDGIADFAVVNGYEGSTQARAPFQIISGKTGREVWRPAISPVVLLYPKLLETRDLDGDGQAEVIYIAELGFRQPGGAQPAPSQAPLWLMVFDGKTGQVRWQDQLNDRPNATTGYEKVPYAVTYADLNGDKTLEIITPAVTIATQYPELRAYDGRTGKQLWNAVPLPGSGGPNGDYVIDRLPRPTVGDLDGDGQLEILVQDHFLPSELVSRDASPGVRTSPVPETSAPNSAAQGGTPKPENIISRLLVIDGATSAEKWRQDFDTGGNSSQTRDGGGGGGTYRDRSRPLIVRRGPGEQPAIAIWLWAPMWEKPVATLVLLDFKGEELWRLPVNLQMGNRHLGVKSHDVNGDGADDLLFADLNSVQVIDPRSHEPVWKFALPGPGASILSIEPATDKLPATVVVARGRQVFGINGTSGKLSWTVAGLPEDHVPFSMNHPELLRDASGGPPHVLYSSGDGLAACFRATPAAGESARAAVPIALPPKPVRDARFTRPLPWVSSPAGQTYYQSGAPLRILSGALFSLLLVIFPGYLLWQMLVRRRWSLGFFLLIPVAVGLMIVAWQLPLPDQRGWEKPVAAKYALAVLEFPALVGLYLCGAWLWRGEWKWPGLIAVMLAIWTASLASVWISIDRKRCDPAEVYTWDQWWIVLLMGAYSLLVAVTVIWIVMAILRAIWRFLVPKPD